MTPVTKTLVYGGIAIAVLGPTLVIGTGVSIAAGSGTFMGGALQDMLPAFVDGFQNYEGGQTPGLFGEAPVEPAPAG